MLTEAFRPAAMSFFAETVEPARRKSAFAVYRLAINLGMAIGPAVGGILATIAFKYLFFVDGATSIAAGLVLAAVALPERKEEEAALPRRHSGPDHGDAPAPLDRRAPGSALPLLSGRRAAGHGHLLPAHLLDASLHRRRPRLHAAHVRPPLLAELPHHRRPRDPLERRDRALVPPSDPRPRRDPLGRRASARWPSRGISGRSP